MIYPDKFTVYKGKGGKWGACQFKLFVPQEDRSGVVFLETAPVVGEDKYDWNQKITFALGVTDLGKLLLYFVTGQDPKLVHDPSMGKEGAGEVFKALSFFSPKGVLQGCMLTLSEKKKGSDPKEHKIPMTGDELLTLKVLVEYALPKILHWDFS